MGVILRVELTQEDIRRLVDAFNAGELKHLGISNIYPVDINQDQTGAQQASDTTAEPN